MPYMYNCPRCGTTSKLYTLRSGAEGHGKRHRRTRHDGDFPTGERIEHIAWTNPTARHGSWHPTKGDAVVIVIAVCLVIWGAWHQINT